MGAVRIRGPDGIRRRAVLGTVLFLGMILYGIPEAKAVTGSIEVPQVQEETTEEMTPREEEALKKELERLRKELLRYPKRDRLRFGGDFDITYDSNVDRNVIRSEEGDTLFRMTPFVELDLGGRKTDLSVEFRWNRQYNAKVSEGKDLLNMEWRVRAGRKIGKKLTLSLNDRLNYQSERDETIDDDGKKIKWDNSHRASLNYEVNRKLSLNFDADYTRRDFPHENFDQDGDYSIRLDPNLFFYVTPKTRLSLGYQWNVVRDRTETSDATNHQFRVGYFGQITGKSTLEADVRYTFQDPDSAIATRSDEVVASLAYIWQITPKTSFRALYSHTFEHGVSDSVSGVNLLKLTTRTTSDSLSVSLRLRPHRRISAEISFDPTHSHSKTRETGKANVRSRTFAFPIQVAADYQVAAWLRLRFSYTYRHQIGNEDSDEHRAHTWFIGTNLVF